MSPLNITQPLDSIRYMVYIGYYKVMSNIPKMGHLTTPAYFGLFRYPVFLTTQHSGHSLPLHPLHQAAALVVAALLDVAALFTATFRLHACLGWALSNGLKRNPYPVWLDAESWLVYTCNYIHRHSLLNTTWYDRIWQDMTGYDMIWHDMILCDMMWCDVIWY